MADKGCHAVTFSENPEKLGHPSWHSDHWDPVPCRRARRRARSICLHIGSSSQTHHHRDGRADRRDDHAAADEHRAVRGRPRVVAGVPQVPEPAGRAVRGRHRLDPVLPRADRLRVPAPPRVDEPGLRRQAPEPGVQREHPHLLHRRRGRDGGAPPPQHRPHPLGVRLPPLRLHVAERAGDGDEVPRRRCPTRRSTRSRTSTPCGTSTTTRSPTSRGSSARWARCGPRPPTSTPRLVSHGTGKFQDEGIVTAMTLAERICEVPSRARRRRRVTRLPLPGPAGPRRREPLLLDVRRGRPAPVPPLPGLRLLPAPAVAALPAVRQPGRSRPRR